MFSLSHILRTTPRALPILVTRLVLFALSFSALCIYAVTLHTYKTSIVEALYAENNNNNNNNSLNANRNSLLVTNALPLAPLTLSVCWSVFEIAILGVRGWRVWRRDKAARGCGRTRTGGCKRNNTATSGGWCARSAPITTSAPAAHDDRDQHPRPLVHPAWDVAVDFLCWALLVAAAVVTGTAAGNWKAGRLAGGMVVDPKACPSFDAVTGVLDYWCGEAWGQVLGLTSAGSSVMGTAAGLHFCRMFYSSFDLYYLRQRRRTEDLQAENSSDDSTVVPPPPYQTQGFESEQMNKEGAATVY